MTPELSELLESLPEGSRVPGQKLIDQLLKAGGSAGNRSIIRQLGWTDAEYFDIRNLLIEHGIVLRGRGKGGSTHLVADDPLLEDEVDVLPDEVITSVRERSRREHDLYDPIEEVLQSDWTKHQWLFEQSLVVRTASQGRRPTGGKWSRPDFVIVAVNIFPYLPVRYLEAITLEVKPWGAIDVSAVFEALAHRGAATRSYVWLEVPKDKEATFEDRGLPPILEEATRHGIGVIQASKASKPDSWNISLEAQRYEPEPEALNSFLAIQLDQQSKEKLAKWVH